MRGHLSRALLIVMLLATIAPMRYAAHGAGTTAGAWALPLPVVTGDRALDGAERVALGVLAQDTQAGLHLASPSYNSPWIRDSFAWGMIPWVGSLGGPLAPYSGSEIDYWLGHQQHDGSWVTNIYSGYYDETPIIIGALADSYALTGDRKALSRRLPAAERAWNTLRREAVQPRHGSPYLVWADLGAHVATDWADQVARVGYATGLEALWYHATRSMALLEAALGRPRTAARYDRFATGIAREINRLLWRTGAPHARDVVAVAAAGHYTAWLGGRDYFEVDSNALCILYGIAPQPRAASIARFLTAHAGYIFGLRSRAALPARTVYGDYEPADYARIHYGMADGVYQNGYWASVGALAAMALARSGDGGLALQVLRRIAAGLLRQGNTYEWYRADGRPSGAAYYQWPARLYLVALYATYLGLSDRWVPTPGRAAPIACLGGGMAEVARAGRRLRIAVWRGPRRGGGFACQARTGAG